MPAFRASLPGWSWCEVSLLVVSQGISKALQQSKVAQGQPTPASRSVKKAERTGTKKYGSAVTSPLAAGWSNAWSDAGS